MITEELIRIILSFLSLFTSETSRLVKPNTKKTSCPNGEKLEENDQVDNKCTTSAEDNILVRTPLTTSVEQAKTSLLLQDYGTIYCRREKPTWRQSFSRSTWISFTINAAVIPLGLLMFMLLYISLNTTNLCFEWMQREGKLPKEIMEWQLIGNDVEDIIVNFWFQFTLILLFGWQKFKSDHSSTMILGFLLGCTVAIYKTILFTLKLDYTRQYFRYPGNFLFLIGIAYSSYLVTAKICKTARAMAFRKIQISAIISTQFFLGFIIAMIYRYVIVPWFNELKNEINKAIVAMITPVVIVIPMVICEQLALESSTIADPGRSFVLVYFMKGVSILLYRIMQADVKSIWIFVALSLFSGFLQVVRKATEKLRHKVLTRFWRFVGDVCHCTRLGELTYDTARHQRLRVDKEIQVMLYENTALVLSQAYLALYFITNFDNNARGILEQSFVRISIGLGINFFVNSMLILIHIHWYKTEIQEVWFRYWKLHMEAAALNGAMTIWYFTPVLLTVFQVPTENPASLKIKNCTTPL